MTTRQETITRRHFLKTSSMIAGALTLPSGARALAETNAVRRANYRFQP